MTSTPRPAAAAAFRCVRRRPQRADSTSRARRPKYGRERPAGSGTRRSAQLVLAADVGGTKTALALASARGDSAPQAVRHVPSAAWPDFETLAEDFLATAGRPRLAAVAIAAAGPVDAGALQVTNLPWRIEVSRVARALGAPRIALLNDLAATALGMLELPAQDFAVLQGAALRRPGTLAVLAAGTGLGAAILVFDGERPRALPSEGGHASFAARGPREAALLQHLAGAQGAHVSVEHVVSGPGLVRIHEFLLGLRGGPPARQVAAARRSGGDVAAAIAASGLRGEDPLCAEALELFAGCYGSEAGNLALRALSHGGVWLGGGIAPKLLPLLRRGGFLEAFRDKGRFRDWLAELPVAVCLAEDAALRGALREARRLARGGP